jgi:homoserine kinase type II
MVMIDNPLFAACENRFGFHVHHAERIQLGWLNLKWILSTDQGRFVFKKYHPARYQNREMLEFALQQQNRLHQAGIPCPALLESEDAVLHESADGPFIVMRYEDGQSLSPAAASEPQLYDLGRITAIMHNTLNDGTLPSASAPQFLPPSRESRIAHWDAAMEQAVQLGHLHLVPQIELQRDATFQIDLESLSSCDKGWAHRDLWADNLLFEEDRVSAVLDFDRLNFDYPELDVARVVLSLSLHQGRLQRGALPAFLKGYRENRTFPASHLVRAIRLLWYLESEWWIRGDRQWQHPIPCRFAEEMHWIASHRDNLKQILG